jgi:hypothetical protein
MCADKTNPCGPDERRSLLHGESFDPGEAPGPTVREAWHPELAAVRHGSFSVPVPLPGKWRVKFMSDGCFTVYALDECDNVVAVLGPSSSDGRQLVVSGPVPGASSLTVTALDDVLTSYTVTDYCRKHSPDQTPVAVHVDDAPDSMEDMVKRMIQTEFSKWAETQQHGTFEEEDDFDIPDDDLLPPTPYELTEMQEEFVEEPGPPPERKEEPRDQPPEPPPQAAPAEPEKGA